MSDKKDTFTLFGVELGTCDWAPAGYRRDISLFGGFKANEIGASLGLIDSELLEVHYDTGCIFDVTNEPRVELNHSISLGMNVPVIDTIGD